MKNDNYTNDGNKTKKKKKNKVIRIILIIFIVILFLVAIGLIVGTMYINGLLSKINYVEITQDKGELGISDEITIGDQYKNIALFGVDARTDTYTNTRSDCIIIAVLNNEAKTIKLVSIYRDTYLSIKGSLDKVTHAYAYGGPELALNTINRNLDLNITNFATANFYAVMDMIDEIGGIDIEIETKEELKYLNEYIRSINYEENKNSPEIETIGVKHLNGVQALAYSRIRYTAGGDWKRTERMRTVLTAAFNKLKKMSLVDIDRIIRKLLPAITTNINSSEILGLIPQITQYTIDESVGWPYVVKGATINGVWYGPPVTLESCVKKLHEEVFQETDYVPSQVVKQISNQIIKKTGYK